MNKEFNVWEAFTKSTMELVIDFEHEIVDKMFLEKRKHTLNILDDSVVKRDLFWWRTHSFQIRNISFTCFIDHYSLTSTTLDSIEI